MNIYPFVCFMVLLPVIAVASPSVGDKVATKEPLASYLTHEATNLDVFYTIEEYYQPNQPVPEPIGSAMIEPKPASDVAHLVIYLRGQLPEADISVSMAHPKVVHIVNKGLIKQKGYSLNKTLGLTYEGVLSDLPRALASATGDNIRFLNTSNLAIIDVYSSITQTQIKTKSATGREILTTATLLPGCNRELWEAYTSAEHDKEYTTVYFPTHSH